MSAEQINIEQTAEATEGQQTSQGTQTPETTSNPSGGAKNSSNDWLSNLDKEYSEHKNISSFKNPNELARAYLHANSLIGKRVEELSQDELNSFLGNRAKPEAATDYDLSVFGEGNQGAEVFREAAFKAGLNKFQAEHIANEYAKFSEEFHEAEEKRIEQELLETKEGIKKTFGEGYQRIIDDGKRAIAHFSKDEEEMNQVLESIYESGLGINASFLKVMAGVGESLRENNIVAGEPGVNLGMTPSEAEAEIKHLRSDPNFMNMYRGKGSPADVEYARERMSKLYKIKNPGKA